MKVQWKSKMQGKYMKGKPERWYICKMAGDARKTYQDHPRWNQIESETGDYGFEALVSA
jgi:hypothetical protein